MKPIQKLFYMLMLIILGSSCSQTKETGSKIVFLAHSTGIEIWFGNKTSRLSDFVTRRNIELGLKMRPKAIMPSLFKTYNKEHGTSYNIDLKVFPKMEPYGWNNYPYDYYNIWVKNGDDLEYMEEPTLNLLTQEYGIVIFKHCFPVCQIQADLDSADINSEIKTVGNYQLQYNVLKNKLLSYPNTKFILFTGATHVQSQLSEEEAIRAQNFFNWVINTWDTPDDNIYLWDLYGLQTEGGLYLKNEYATAEDDPHPNIPFSQKAARLLLNRIVDVIENDGKTTSLTGEPMPN